MVPASKAITLFLRTLLVSPKLNSVGLPLAAREKQNVACLLWADDMHDATSAHTYNIVLRHAAHPPALAGADLCS